MFGIALDAFGSPLMQRQRHGMHRWWRGVAAVGCGWVALLLAGCLAPVGSPPIFDARDPTVLRLSNAYYDLTFAKSNGALHGLIDRQTKEPLLLGSSANCLWALDDADQGKMAVDSCAYVADTATTFAYRWDERAHRLTLLYEGNSVATGGPLRVAVTVTPSAATWVDLQLQVVHGGDQLLRRVALPATLQLDPAAVHEALVPTLPGVLLEQPFFAKRARYEALYPSWQGLFADYVALRVHNSTLTLYSVAPPDQPVSARLAFVNNRDVIQLSHTFHPYLPGRLRSDRRGSEQTTWQTPTVRLQVGRPYTATIAGYRRANQLDSFPDLRTKLADR
ncbi:MAG: hypothetical protein KDE31_33380, partial [Caldilineaceae bacterium]|nr:hypothetical protein [Caldilineaceae bacterium]